MCGRSSSTRSVSVRIVRAAPGSASARWARVSSSPTWMVSQGRPWSRSGRRRCARVSAARASSMSRLVKCDARRRHVRERACRVVTEALPPRRAPAPPVRVRPASRQAPCFAARSASCACARMTTSAARLASPASTPSVRSSVALSVAPSSACAVPRRTSAAGLHPLCRGELIERQIAVGERLLDTVGHHARPQVGDPGLDRGAAIRERVRRGCPLGESEPPLGIRRPARQRSDPGSLDGECGVLPQLIIAEPPQPLVQGLHPAVVVERQCKASTKPATVSVSPAACP